MESPLAAYWVYLSVGATVAQSDVPQAEAMAVR